jgi:hypothetical protein
MHLTQRSKTLKDSFYNPRPHNISGSLITGPQITGKLEDIIDDAETGQQVFAIVSFHMPWAEKKFYVLPISYLHLEKDKYHLDMAKNLLSHLPHFDQKVWPDFSNATLQAELFKFFYFMLLKLQLAQ